MIRIYFINDLKFNRFFTFSFLWFQFLKKIVTGP